MPRKSVPYKIPYLKATPENTGATAKPWVSPPESVPHSISRFEMRRNPRWAEKYEWRENVKFEANIKFLRMMWGGKALFENTESLAQYYMSQTGLEKMLQTKTIIYGCVLGTWKFKKHGSTYSIYPV